MRAAGRLRAAAHRHLKTARYGSTLSLVTMVIGTEIVAGTVSPLRP